MVGLTDFRVVWAQSVPLVRSQPNTLLLKRKPDYPTATQRRARAARPDPLPAVLKQINATAYTQKFPGAQTYPDLKPGETDLTLIYQVYYAGQAYSFAKIRQLLLATGVVEYVEPVYVPALLHQPNDPLADSVNVKQYYLDQIQAYKGWNIQKGDSTVVIGILDTGTHLTHEDLQGSIQPNYADPVDGLDNDHDGYIDNFYGWDLADDDPDPTAQDGHGTRVTGIAAATPNNGKGLTGVGYNCRYLPVKVFSSKAGGSFAGYEGIVYAADHGCQVINLSWGNAGYYSRYEQDVINYAAVNKNAVVVAAGGNTPRALDFYPASYENVLSVVGVDQNDVKGSAQTYSHQVDLTAAGSAVMSTTADPAKPYTTAGGSSFAAPIVAGCAGLLRRQFPAYTALQIAARLRATADDIYAVGTNGKYPEQLGRGRVNLYRALTDRAVKAVRNQQSQFDPTQAFAGDTLDLSGTFQNILDPVADLVVTLSSASPYVTVLQPTFRAGALATHASITNQAQPFRVLLRADTPANQKIEFRYGFADGAYSDYQYFTITVNPNYLTLRANHLMATITSQGNIGYNGLNYEQGEGVGYRRQASLLGEGGLLVGLAPDRVTDNIRNEKLTSDANFTSLTNLRWVSNGKQAAEATGVFRDTYPAAGTVGIRVKQRALAWPHTPNDNFILLEYTLTNTTEQPLTELYAGLFADWDIHAFDRNVASWDSVNHLGYVYQPDQPDLYAGIALLTPQPATYYAIHNAETAPDTIHLTDGFTTAEKYTVLRNTAPEHYTAGGPVGSDVSQVVGGRVTGLAPGQSVTLAFALLGGDHFADLQTSAAAAQQKYRELKAGPAPVPEIITSCAGSSVTLAPRGGRIFKFYTDAAATQLLSSGPTYTPPPLTNSTTYYVSNADSLYESKPAPFTVTVTKPAVQFSVTPDSVTTATRGTILFTDATPAGRAWRWSFGNGTASQEQNPSVTYHQPGVYAVTLTVTDVYGCVDSLTKLVEIKNAEYPRPWSDGAILLYPNPVPRALTVNIGPEVDTTAGIQLTCINHLGQTVFQTTTYQTGPQQLPLTGLTNGIYYFRISGKNGITTRRVELLRE